MELVTDTAALRPNVMVPSDDNRGLLIPLMSRKDRVVFFCLAAVWAVSLFSFWGWWLNPEHNSGPVRFVINSLVLFWATVIPGDLIFIFSRCASPIRPDVCR
jgi:hypothetical protein